MLFVGGGEHVLDGDVREGARVGLGEAAAGCLDVADLLAQRAVWMGLGVQLDSVADERHLEVALEGADLAAGGAAGLALVGAGVCVPGAGECAEVGAAAVAVR